MGIVKAAAEMFRSASNVKATDRYGILSPLLATGDYVTTTKDMYVVFKNSTYASVVSGKTKPTNKNVEKAVEAYRLYVKSLPGQEQGLEKAEPFSTIVAALDSVSGNIVQIEDNFKLLFGNVRQDKPETSLKSSSLVVIGYLEKADNFSTWLGSLAEHLTADDGDMVPPFRTKEMMNRAATSAEFALANLHKWNTRTSSFLNEIKDMQQRGSDVSIQSEHGVWIDETTHDDQFTSAQQNLITVGMRNPILMVVTMGQVRAKDKIDLLTSRKDWLTSKIILEQSKLRGMDHNSPEYKRLKKATDHYADLVSRYEQKIERMRA